MEEAVNGLIQEIRTQREQLFAKGLLKQLERQLAKYTESPQNNTAQSGTHIEIHSWAILVALKSLMLSLLNCLYEAR